MIMVVFLIGGDIDYYMAIFISHPISLYISPQSLYINPDGSQADIQQPWANIGCDIKITM